MDLLKKNLEYELEAAENNYTQELTNNEWYIKPIRISKQLATFLKVPPNTKLCRSYIYQRIHLYLYKKGLLQGNQHFILDNALKKIFDITKKPTRENMIKVIGSDKYYSEELQLADIPFILIEY